MREKVRRDEWKGKPNKVMMLLIKHNGKCVCKRGEERSGILCLTNVKERILFFNWRDNSFYLFRLKSF